MPNYFQTSGAISFSELQSRFGGSNPINFSEYYRNGSYVDGTATTTTTQGPSYSYGGTSWYYMSPTLYIFWGNNTVYQANTSSSTTSVTTGGWTYTRGTFQNNDGYGLSYSVSRSQSTTTNINTGIPTSSTISLNQFYGAQY